MKRLRLMALSSMLVVPSSASAQVTVGQGDQLEFRSGARRFVAHLGEQRLEGPLVDLVREGQRLSGALPDKRADVRWARGRIAGRIGASQLRVVVRQRGAGFELVGSLGPSPILLRASASRIMGDLGGCEYALAAAGGAYEGWRNCGDSPVPVAARLEFPAALVGSSDAETGALLLLALAVEPASSPPPTGETLQNPRVP